MSQNASRPSFYIDLACLHAFWAVLFGCLLLTSTAHSQTSSPLLTEPRFSQLSSDIGLSQDTINAMLIDSDGFLWLATESGLNRYDGYHLQQIRGPNNEFADDSIYALFEDTNGDIWTSTLSRGVFRIDRDTGAVSNPIKVEYKGYDNWYQTAEQFIQVGDDTLLVVLLQSIVEITLSTGKQSLIFDLLEYGLEDVDIIRFVARTDDILFLATSAGLMAIDQQTGNVVKIDHLGDVTANRDNVNVKYLHIEDDHQLWIGSVEGLYMLPLQPLIEFVKGNPQQPAAQRKVSLLNIWDMARHDNKLFYLATDQGLYTFNLDTEQLEFVFRPTDSRLLLSDDDITQILETDSQQLWLATPNDGALLWSPRSTLFENVLSDAQDPRTLSSNLVYSFYQENDLELWVGTQNGLNRYDLQTGDVQRFLVTDDKKAVYSAASIIAMKQAEPGFVWLITGIGIRKFDLNKGKVVPLNLTREGGALFDTEEAYGLMPDNQNGALLVSERRFWRVDFSTGELVNSEILSTTLNADNFYGFFPDVNGDSDSTLITMMGELWRYNTRTKELVKLHEAQQVHSEYAVAPSNFVMDDNGILWVTYPGNGLYGLDPDTFEQKHFFNVNNGLPTNMVFGLKKDADGNIWMSSHKGVLKLFPDSLQIVRFDAKDGLATNEFNWGADIQLPDGRIVYGSQSGFTLFNPSDLTSSVDAFSKVVITNVGLVSKPLSDALVDFSGQRLTLEHDDLGLTIQFSNMHYDQSQNAEYAYSLNGESLVEYPITKQPQVTFPALEPGEYTFSVSTFDLTTGEKGPASELRINVKYPPFASPLAYTIYTILAVIVIIVIQYRRQLQNEAIRAAHRETLRSESRLSMALMASNSNVWEWDADSNRILEPRLSAELGYLTSHDEQSLHDHVSMIHREDRDSYLSKWSHAIKNSDAGFDVTYRLQAANGDYLWYRDVGSMVKSADNAQLKMVGTYTNMTESMDNMEKVQLFGEAFQHTRDWVVIFNRNFQPIVTNQAFNDALGVDPSRNMQNEIQRVFQAQQSAQPEYLKKMRELKAGEHWNGEAQVTSVDGRVYDVAIGISTVTSLHNEQEIDRYLAILSDISEQKEAEAALRKLANYDNLTGLPNRTLLLDRIKHACDQAKRDKFSVGLFFIDLDRFKQVNDSLGHDAGDDLLKLVTERISGVLRESDTVARLGGDEFVVMVEHVEHIETLSHLAANMIKAIEEPVELRQQTVSVSASIGIALYPEDATSPDELLKSADIAMYHAKDIDSTGFQYFTAQMNQLVQAKLKLENQVKLAHTNKQFVNYYQPIVDAQSNVVEGFELLMRWPTDAGMISPDEFIPVAEDLGLIVDMTWNAIDDALRLLKQWQQINRNLYLSINLSARHFSSTQHLDEVVNKLNEENISPSNIRFEITESALMSDYERAMTAMADMKARGFVIALDDFGTGYSSLKYLKDFPIDVIKIDKSFVQDIGVNESNEGIILATLRMAESLKMKCVAEGIETQEQVQFFCRHQCHYLQGYYFSKPVPGEDIPELIKELKGVVIC